MYKTLNDLDLNSVGIVKSLNCTGSIRRRLLDLGLVKNTKITPLFKSPSRGSYCLWNKGNCYCFKRRR